MTWAWFTSLAFSREPQPDRWKPGLRCSFRCGCSCLWHEGKTYWLGYCTRHHQALNDSVWWRAPARAARNPLSADELRELPEAIDAASRAIAGQGERRK